MKNSTTRSSQSLDSDHSDMDTGDGFRSRSESINKLLPNGSSRRYCAHPTLSACDQHIRCRKFTRHSCSTNQHCPCFVLSLFGPVSFVDILNWIWSLLIKLFHLWHDFSSTIILIRRISKTYLISLQFIKIWICSKHEITVNFTSNYCTIDEQFAPIIDLRCSQSSSLHNTVGCHQTANVNNHELFSLKSLTISSFHLLLFVSKTYSSASSLSLFLWPWSQTNFFLRLFRRFFTSPHFTLSCTFYCKL